VAGSCEDGKETSGSINGGNFFFYYRALFNGVVNFSHHGHHLLESKTSKHYPQAPVTPRIPAALQKFSRIMKQE
jgi:hypothetical protein